jgi:hypothetical protein
MESDLTDLKLFDALEKESRVKPGCNKKIVGFAA